MARMSPGRVLRWFRIDNSDRRDVGQSLTALAIAVLGALVAGLTLTLSKGTLEELPGLLILVPAAIALRGNVFGALGSRLSTTIHTGTFGFSRRPDTIVSQNVIAAMVLAFVSSLALAIMAAAVAVVFDTPDSIGVGDYVVISVAGGAIASLLVLAITMALVTGSVRFGWDLDNVTAPLVTASGDVVTVPSLLIAAQLAGAGAATNGLAGILAVTCLVSLVWALRTRLVSVVSIVRESLPVLVFAGTLSLVAGAVIERRLDSFVTYGALLVLLPGYLGSAGALGGILSSRLSSKLHLGLIEPHPVPGRVAWADIRLCFLMAAPIFVFNALVSHSGAVLVAETSPGILRLVLIALLGGLASTAVVAIVAYYGTIAAVRFGLDPDNYGIPLVTSSLDVAGAFTLVLAVVIVGVG